MLPEGTRLDHLGRARDSTSLLTDLIPSQPEIIRPRMDGGSQGNSRCRMEAPCVSSPSGHPI